MISNLYTPSRPNAAANLARSSGFSLLASSITVPSAAIALGARVIEKHFTIDKHMEGPDHKASLDPNELKSMVNAIRNIENALGDVKNTE